MINADLLKDIQNYIDCNLVVLNEEASYCLAGSAEPLTESRPKKAVFRGLAKQKSADMDYCGIAPAGMPCSLELPPRDESFREMLFRIIDERGEKDSDVYKRAQLSRGHFNKIKNEEGYRPKLSTVVALGLALGLERPVFDEMLRKAGYALSRTTQFDLIIEYCLEHGIYDISEVNEILINFDQELLGAGIRE